MPKMPESEKKEESAESREEAKEQERLKAAEAKRIEKERTERYAKLKDGAKDERAKMREKVGIVMFSLGKPRVITHLIFPYPTWLFVQILL